MKIWSLSLFVIFMSSCSVFERRDSTPQKMVRDQSQTATAPDKGGMKYRLLILPFLDASAQRPASFRESARKRFILELNRTAQVMALPSEEFKLEIPLIDAKSQEYNMPQLIQTARNLGVSGVFEGKVLEFRVKRKTGQVGIVRNLRSTFECVIRARIYAIRGGKEIFNTIKTVAIEQDDIRVAERINSDQFIETHPELTESMIQEAFMEFIPQILKALEKVQWEGRVAAVQGERVYLNVGKLSGLKVGDILKVIDEGDEVYDPETGQRIGQVQGKLKGTLEVVSFFGKDGSVAVIHSGAGFKENDHVELY